MSLKKLLRRKRTFYLDENNKIIKIPSTWEIQSDELIEVDFPLIKEINQNFSLFWHSQIERYIVYKFIDYPILVEGRWYWEYIGKWIKYCVLHDGNRQYQEPGYWLYWKLREEQLDELELKEYGKTILDLTPEEKRAQEQMLVIHEEMQKDWQRVVSQKSTFQLGQIGPARKQKKHRKVFVGLKTARVLGYMDN